MNNDIRNLSKWLNEEQETPIDRQALARVLAMAEQQEPVAWGVDWGRAGDQSCVSIIKRLPDGGIEVLATEYGPPASKPWVGLTEDDLVDVVPESNTPMSLGEAFVKYARAIEAKLKEKNA